MFNKYPMSFLWPQIWETLIYRIPEPRFICSSPSCMGEPMRIQLTLHSWPSNLLEEEQESPWNAVCPGVQELVTDPHTPETSFKAEESFGEMDSWLHCHLRPRCSDFLFYAWRSMFSRDQRPLAFGEGFVFTFGADSREARGSISQVPPLSFSDMLLRLS